MDKETERQALEAFGHISKVNPDDPSTFEVPSHEAIAEMLPSILSNASTRCPICAVSGVHTHSPAEIVIYRNGVKYGRLLSAWEVRGRASGQHVQGELFVEKVILDVAELADRNSPEDFPEGMIVTADELKVILERHLNDVASGQQGVVPDDLLKALEDLSFECFSVTDTRAPSLETYNRTFGVIEKYRLLRAASSQITSPANKELLDIPSFLLDKQKPLDLAAQPSDSVQGWQDIETAPYATPVLAWLHLPKNTIASAQVIAQRVYVHTEDSPEKYPEHERLTVGCWWANGRYYAAGHVTHWRPLPEPPGGN